MTTQASNDDNFYARALESLNNQMSLANNTAAGGAISTADAESYAKSLVEEDFPKIDSAVKGYLSLVAARSAVASDVDVIAEGSALGARAQCIFASTTSATGAMHANRCALVCARTLVSAINSTTVPMISSNSEVEDAVPVKEDNESKVEDEEEVNMQFENVAARMLWNKLVRLSSTPGDKAKQRKPSKVLGKDSLIVSYPYIRERFRRGVALHGDKIAASSPTPDDVTMPAPSQSKDPVRLITNELLPPVVPPAGIDIDQWKAFYTEFGSLLSRACNADEREKPQSIASMADDDSAILWSNDGGSAELRQRREMRARRAADALASVDGAKADVANALGELASGEVLR